MLTQEEYAKRYDALKELSLELAVDPVVEGLNSLTKKLSEVQHLRNRIGKAFAEAIHNKSEAEIAQSVIEHQMEVEMAKVMMTDENVRGQKSEKMRDLAAQAKMPGLVLDKHQKDVNLIRAEAYEKYVKQIYDTLEAANTNLSRQISVVQMSVELGEVDSNLRSSNLTVKHAAH